MPFTQDALHIEKEEESLIKLVRQERDKLQNVFLKSLRKVVSSQFN